MSEKISPKKILGRMSPEAKARMAAIEKKRTEGGALSPEDLEYIAGLEKLIAEKRGVVRTLEGENKALAEQIKKDEELLKKLEEVGEDTKEVEEKIEKVEDGRQSFNAGDVVELDVEPSNPSTSEKPDAAPEEVVAEPTNPENPKEVSTEEEKPEEDVENIAKAPNEEPESTEPAVEADIEDKEDVENVYAPEPYQGYFGEERFLTNGLGAYFILKINKKTKKGSFQPINNPGVVEAWSNNKDNAGMYKGEPGKSEEGKGFVSENDIKDGKGGYHNNIEIIEEGQVEYRKRDDANAYKWFITKPCKIKFTTVGEGSKETETSPKSVEDKAVMESKEKFKPMYSIYPDGENGFTFAKLYENPEDRFYKIEQISENEATYELTEDTDLQITAARSANSILRSGFVFENQPSETKSKVTTTQKGKLRKESNQWTIVDQGRIKFE